MQSSAYPNETTALKSAVQEKGSTNNDHPFKKMIEGIGSQSQHSSSLTKESIDEGQLNDGEEAVFVSDTEQKVDSEDETLQIVTDFSLSEEALEETNEQTLAYLFEQIVDDAALSGKLIADLRIKDLTQIDIDTVAELGEEFLMQVTMILDQLKQLLATENSNQDIEHVARDLHKLFQLWSQFAQEQKQQLISNLQLNKENEQALLRHLLSLFEKRNSFAKQQVYQTNASITQEDVEKWLQQALDKYSLLDQAASTINVSQTQPLQMNHIQQYTLHVTEGNRIDAISRNLASDLSNIINRSSFLKQAGLEELTLTLRPHSLGDVTIRLAQINGEMTVRFLVTTEAAKKLFEANLHQLKPMFAPNQVVVERDMTIRDDDFFQESQEQLEEEHKEEEKDQQAMTEDTKEKDLSFEDILHFLSEEANE